MLNTHMGFQNLKSQRGGGVLQKAFGRALVLTKQKALLFRARQFRISSYRTNSKVTWFPLRDARIALVAPSARRQNPTAPIRESEAVFVKYFADFGFDFGFLLILKTR